jgi:hypothetical protein|tara:strand:+ start:932 stop:1120 length:189 start_codon:yes stop_codon:yes gene_type:complete
MNKRKLQSGQSVPELEKAVTLTIYTKCPEKYKLIDMETGEEYVGYSTSGKNSWNKLEKIDGI